MVYLPCIYCTQTFAIAKFFFFFSANDIEKMHSRICDWTCGPVPFMFGKGHHGNTYRHLWNKMVDGYLFLQLKGCELQGWILDKIVKHFANETTPTFVNTARYVKINETGVFLGVFFCANFSIAAFTSLLISWSLQTMETMSREEEGGCSSPPRPPLPNPPLSWKVKKWYIQFSWVQILWGLSVYSGILTPWDQLFCPL